MTTQEAPAMDTTAITRSIGTLAKATGPTWDDHTRTAAEARVADLAAQYAATQDPAVRGRIHANLWNAARTVAAGTGVLPSQVVAQALAR